MLGARTSPSAARRQARIIYVSSKSEDKIISRFALSADEDVRAPSQNGPSEF
jgi:hypothetical protein